MTQSTINADEVLQPYVPRLLISWLRETPEARHREVDGSLAFVDISGFTQLTERLSRKGKVGSEEISDTLDSCFGQLLSVAYDYDAGVVKWGGDAVLLLFTGDDHAARACRASTGMHRTLRSIGSLKTSAGLVRLRMSTGIHSGRFDFFLAGDLHRDLVLTGPGANETIRMESAADAGETVVSGATAALLDPTLLGAARDGGRLLRRAPEAQPQRAGPAPDSTGLALERCFSPAIREQLLAGTAEPEHRLVTAAFVEFRGVDELLEHAGPDALADALDECLGTVQEAAARHDVAIFDNDPSPGGGKIMLVAGAPRSTGADEERMLRTLRQAVDGAGTLPLRAGVNCGRVFADEFGPYYRRTYTVKGDAVNLAARLMGKAEPGQILAAEAVLARSRTTFELEPVEPFLVKGKAEPVAAARVGPVLSSRAAATGDVPLVGREDEVAHLVDALDAARGGDGRLVEVVGEAGIGKSRLVEDLRVRASGMSVLTAACEEYESSTAYFPFRGLLRDLLGIGPGDDPTTASRRLAERVGATAPQLAPWLPLLAIPLELDIAPTPESDRLDEKFRKARLEQVTSEFLGEILSAPTLFVVEDTHWLDDASGDLLRRLARDAHERPWLILTTRRPEAAAFAGPDLPGSATLALEALTPAAAAQLVRAATEDVPLPPHQLAALAERAGGNPLFLTELVAASRVTEGEALPDSVEALVTAQIDRLPPADRTLLRYAAVLGRSFENRLLAASLEGRAEPPDDAAWERLAGFLGRDSKGLVRFRHALIRDAAYEGLPYRRRRELHARVGETIEGMAGAKADGQAELLSLHFFHAQRFEEAWRYSRLAGEHARSIYANAEAVGFYIRALDAARRLDGVAATDFAEVSEALGDALESLGLFRKSAVAYRDARRRRAGDTAAEAALMLKEGWIPEREGRYPQALRWFGRGLRLLDGIDGADIGARRAQLMMGYATVRQMQGRSTEAVRWCRQAIVEAERVGERRALAHAYHIMDWAYLELGQPEEAVYAPLALPIYKELGNFAGQANAQNAMGARAYFEGRWDEAVELYEQAARSYEAAGDPVRRADAVFNIAEIRCDQEQLEEAHHLLDDALRVWKAAGWRVRIALGTRLYGVIALRADRPGDAMPLFEQAREGFAEVGAQNEVTATDGRIIECLLQGGDVERARPLAVGCATSIGARNLHLPMLQRLLGRALLQSGDLVGARAALQESLRAGRERRARYEVALTLGELVRLARAEGGAVPVELEAERDAILAGLGVVVPAPAPPVIEAAAPVYG